MKCPCCNKQFSLEDYIKGLLAKTDVLEEEELPTYVTDRKGNLNPWYDKRLRYIHKKLLDIHKDFGKTNSNKRYKYFEEIQELIKSNTELSPMIWMCDNIWNGDIFIADFYVYNDGNYEKKTEIEVKRVMSNSKMVLSVSGDESYIKAKDILKVIEIVDNVDRFLMAEELLR